MVDPINARSARSRIDVARVGAAAGEAADVIGSASKVTDPVVKLAAVYEESGSGRLPKALEALKGLQGIAEFAQLGLHVADAITNDRPAPAAIDAIFKVAEISIGATTGLARFHPLMAMLDAYSAGLKMSVGLLENKATFDRLLAERRERVAALDAMADRVCGELTPSLLTGMQDACVAAGGFVSFAWRGVLERAASPGARLSSSELIDTARAMADVASASRIFADATTTARAEVELRVVSVGVAAGQVLSLGRRFDAHIETLAARPTPGNRLSAATAELDRVLAEGDSVIDHRVAVDERASRAFERVLTRGRGLVADMVAIERRFESLPALVLARRIRSQGLSPR